MPLLTGASRTVRPNAPWDDVAFPETALDARLQDPSSQDEDEDTSDPEPTAGRWMRRKMIPAHLGDGRRGVVAAVCLLAAAALIGAMVGYSRASTDAERPPLRKPRGIPVQLNSAPGDGRAEGGAPAPSARKAPRTAAPRAATTEEIIDVAPAPSARKAPAADAPAPAAPTTPPAPPAPAAPAGPRQCSTSPGVKVAEVEGTATEAWPKCAAKWSEDCAASGCCLDVSMTCFNKDSKWSACNAKCDEVDAQNDTWTCKKLDPPSPRTHEACVDACRQMVTCQTAIFNADAGGSCSLSTGRVAQVVWAGDNFNSTFCGDASAEEHIKAAVAKVNKGLPFHPTWAEPKNCSWGGEDCSQTQCCNNVACDDFFSNCYGYSCYKKTDYFAGCRIGAPPKDWDGKWLGGGRGTTAVGPAGSKVAVHGTSLYCIAVISWDAPRPKPFWSTEAELANNIKEHGISWMKCDGHDVFDGVQTPKAEWGSFSNIDAFQEIWKAVKAKGNWKKYDWTVKVDSDAVFFPARLKLHLEKLRTPAGAPVYLENTNYRFKFMGALEIVTKEALEIFLEKGHTCIRGKHEGGEDFFMKGCMDALGVGHQTDFDLLHDKYAEQDGPCTDGWAVAYHFHKKVISWNWCYNEAVCGGRAACPDGLQVEYVMPYSPR